MAVDGVERATIAKRTSNRIGTELPRLIAADSSLSLRSVAERANVDPSHLSRALRGKADKQVSADLAARVATGLGLPKDYFPEYREGAVIAAIKADPALRDRVYSRLR